MKPPTEAENWMAVSRNLAQVLLYAADQLDEAGKDGAPLRTAYDRQVAAHFGGAE
jgi:hypothetical protein